MKFNALRITFCVLCLVYFHLPLTLQAQEETDSVMLTGVVVNHHTGRVYGNCLMWFMQEGERVAEVTTESDGSFATGMLPVGRYELHVKLKGLMFHQADLVLKDNAYLRVAVDTIKLITLKAITVVAAKHMLGSLQITSRHDNRLWGFTAGYRNANAVVAMPPDAHGNSDAGEDGGVGGDGPVGTPLFDPNLHWKIVSAIVTGKLGSMLLTPPVWEVVPDVYHSAPKKAGGEGEQEEGQGSVSR